MEQKIYKSFNDLLKQNKGLFKFFRKVKNQGLLKAIWEAREPEVLLLKKEKEQLEKELTLIKESESKLKHQLKLENEKTNNAHGRLDSQMAQSSFLNNELIEWKKNYKELNSNYSKTQSYGKTLDRTLKMSASKIDKALADKGALNSNLKMANAAILQLDCEISELNKLLEQEKSKNYYLASEVDKQSNYATQYKKINNAMSNELHGLNHKIEKLEVSHL